MQMDILNYATKRYATAINFFNLHTHPPPPHQGIAPCQWLITITSVWKRGYALTNIYSTESSVSCGIWHMLKNSIFTQLTSMWFKLVCFCCRILAVVTLTKLVLLLTLKAWLNLKMLVLVYMVLKDFLQNPESGNIAKLSQIHTLLLRLISVMTMTFSCKMHCSARS